MRLLILGAGGIGGYFGGRLAAAGCDVEFLVRSPRAASLAETGLVIRSPLGDVDVPVRTTTSINREYDAILIACKAYDLDNAIESLRPAVGPSTCIVPLLNGVRHLDVLDADFGCERVMGGLCHIGVSLGQDGEINHLNNIQKFVFGSRHKNHEARAKDLHDFLKIGGFNPVLSPNISQDMWEKFTFLAAYAGITTMMRATIGAILQASDGETIINEFIKECISVAVENGYAPRPDAIRQMEATLTERNSAGTASMLRDILRNGPTEHSHILGDMFNRARRAGLNTPTLRISLAHMEAYDASRLGQSRQ